MVRKALKEYIMEQASSWVAGKLINLVGNKVVNAISFQKTLHTAEVMFGRSKGECWKGVSGRVGIASMQRL